jgi:chemotaxis-related protein WspB
MQLLSFEIGGQPYAIESRRVVEVLPLVPARPLPGLPDYLLGLFTFRGSLVPLVDLSRRLGAGPAAERLSTRVVVVDLEAANAGQAEVAVGQTGRRLGLVAEQMIAVRRAEEASTSLPALELAAAPYLDRVLRLGGETVQLLAVDRILPAELAAGLFPAARPAGSRP